MPEVVIDKDKLREYVAQTLNTAELSQQLGKLKDIDWNPFDEDGDEYVGLWAEMKHNWDVVWTFLLYACSLAENLVVDGLSLEAPQKHDLVVGALDDVIHLNWYLEPFDGPALGMLVKAAVSFLNKVGWGDEIEGLAKEKVELAKADSGYKEIG